MDKRVIWALVLCGLVLVVQFALVSNKQRPMPARPEPASAKPAEKTEDAAPAPAAAETPKENPTPAVVAEAKPAVPETPAQDGSTPEVRNDLVLENEWLHTEWTNNATGACTKITYRKEFYADKNRTPLDLLGTYPEIEVSKAEPGKDGALPTVTWTTRKAMVLDVGMVAPEVDLSAVRFTVVKEEAGKIVFEGTISDKDGKLLKLTKTVTLPANSFEMRVELQFSNVSTEKVTFQYDIGAAEAIHLEDPTANVRTARWGPAGVYGSKSESAGSVDAQKGWAQPDEVEQAKGSSLLWGGLENKYFAMLLLGKLPKGTEPGQLMLRATARQIRMPAPGAKEPITGATVRLVSPSIELKPGESTGVQQFIEFVGPKREDVTGTYDGYGFGVLYYSGWYLEMFKPFATFLMFILHKLFYVFQNYGVAIIVLTIIIRVCLHPLTKKGQVAMYKMQKLQPKIRELQTKYKGDKQKLGAEQMKLMREGGANPLSGCLPMLIQIPILIGLYQGLSIAFELRQAPFVLWMTDLSKADGLRIPGIGAVNVLPIGMAVAMFLQQKMTPKSPDPQTQQQMKIMMFMPFIFAFMFYSLPSGLCLYWFVSTLLGMGDQYIINRHLKLHESDANAAVS